MVNIINIIYIRFNYSNIDKLKDRIIIFEKYCLPTLLHQTNKNFHVYLNVNYNDIYYSLVEKYNNYDNISTTDKSIDNVIRSLNTTNCLLVTTRLDTDDSLNILFIDALHKYIKKIKCFVLPTIIDFQDGCQIKQEDNMLRHRQYIRYPSPFISVVTNKSHHVYDFKHNEIHKKYLHLRIATQLPMWLQLCHSNNITNNWSHGKIIGKFNSDLNKFFKIKFE